MRADPRRAAGEAVSSLHVIARSPSRRSNPESLRGKTLDCFAALAMTEFVATTEFTPPPESSPRPRQSRRDSRCPGTSRA
ncbi:hypothetical protein E4K65_41115 [Bradyrhizobium niftali]|uniref:Uncharacterized protein n=1 Tax=Bradyrhizobium niftali TaxID=2560055 RepID=A0A4Y9L9K4_9BRAD|nr:hypothetical protein E4K65_41115 [Bradyrhizobium niftali]